MSSTITISQLAASYGAHQLFHGLDLTLAAGDVVGLVGPNGAGKSTLLKIILGEVAPESGRVVRQPASSTLGYLPQDPPGSGESLRAYAARRTGVGPATVEFEDASAALAHDDSPAAQERYAQALELWLALGGPDLDQRLEELAHQLGLPTDLDRSLGELSGGQAAMIGLVTILLSQHDILLLDEPTNNLDERGQGTLIEFISSAAAPIIIASHDRWLLDEVATSILELDSRQDSVRQYTGGWSAYRREKDLATRQAISAYEADQESRSAIANQAAQQTQWASQGRSKARALGPHQQLTKKFKEDRARKMDQRAARTRRSLERLPTVEAPRKEWELRYTIAEAPGGSRHILGLVAVVAGTGNFRVGPFTTDVTAGDRIWLRGPNGSGKTTLLRTILGDRPPIAGRVDWGVGAQLGVLSQRRDEISGPATLIDRIVELVPDLDAAAARTLLAKFELGPNQVVLPCAELSLGERTRAQLAVFQARQVNFLVLDEPTNHLDAQAAEQLQAALEAFGGTIMLVTHDPLLAKALAPTVVWDFTTGEASAQVDALRTS